MGKRRKNLQSPIRRCVLCGKVISVDAGQCVVGSTGRVVCHECLALSARIADSQRFSAGQTVKQPASFLTPREIIRRLDGAIIGQDRAKRAVAVALWKQQLRAEGDQTVPRSNLLLYGPTGCGKTALVREAAGIVGLPFVSFDATSLSETGYRGRDALDIVRDLAGRHEGNARLPWGVVFLDEFDKLAAMGSENRTAYNRGTQHTLLKLVEGMAVDCGGTTMSTEGLLFVFGGAFSSLTAPKKEPPNAKRPVGFLAEQPEPAKEEPAEIGVTDFVAYGMEPELMGRVGQCVPLEPLTAVQLKCILLDSRLSVYRRYQWFFRNRGVELELPRECMDALVSRTLERGTGARGLNALVEELVEPLLPELAEGRLRGRVKLGEEMHYAG